MMSSLLYISEDHVRSLLEWDSTYKAVERSLLQQFRGKTKQNARSVTSVNDNTHLYAMPGYLEDTEYGALACKLVTASDNSKKAPHLPNLMANIALFDESTGLLKAIVAGTEITTWRTAAASAVATKQLAKSFDVLAIVGAGVQGSIHAVAFQHFFKFRKIQIWNRSSEKAQKLAEQLNSSSGTGDIAQACKSIEICLKDADVIVTATSADSPIIKLDWIKNSAHINAVGVTGGIVSELEMDVYRSGDLYIDHWSGAKQELSNLLKAGIEIHGEIGGLVDGSLVAPKNKRLSIFQSLGMAVEDCAMARLIYDSYSTTISTHN